MPTSKQLPAALQPFSSHGVNLNYREGEDNAEADCPFCGREGKFSIEVNTSQYQCWAGSCKETGNATTFLNWLWQESLAATTDRQYVDLQEERGYQRIDALKAWGVCKSTLTNHWLIPGFKPGGWKLGQLYRWIKTKDKRKLIPTSGLHHCIHGLYDAEKEDIFVLEGPWDGIAWYEIASLCVVEDDDDGIKFFSEGADGSLADKASIIAVPGCNVMLDSWLPLFAGKNVFLMFDNDHPKEKNNGSKVSGAGYLAMERLARTLSEAIKKPKEIHYLAWGPDGYNPELDDGCDMRDYLMS